MDITQKLSDVYKNLSSELSLLSFTEKISHIYNPLEYAWLPYYSYLKNTGNNTKKVIFLGMNPGPWGMAQTGVPFGEISAVTKWLNIKETVIKPEKEHPKRPIEGFNCKRSEVSGRRLWGLMENRFSTPDNFFKDHWVANYCPLCFMTETGKNFTPDKLPKEEQKAVFSLCDKSLVRIVKILKPIWLIGVGKFAEKRINIALKQEIESGMLKSGTILHPSPASPAANKGWDESVVKKMLSYNLW